MFLVHCGRRRGEANRHLSNFDSIFAVKPDLKSSTKTEALSHPVPTMTRFGDDAKLWFRGPSGPLERNGTKDRPLQHIRYLLIILALLQSMLFPIWNLFLGEPRSVSTNDGLIKLLRGHVSLGNLNPYALQRQPITASFTCERTTRFQHRLMNLGLKPPARC